MTQNPNPPLSPSGRVHKRTPEGSGSLIGSVVVASILVALLAACDSAQPPTACGPIPQVTVNAGETATVTACFNDPNGDTLAYSVSSGNPSVATASIVGTTISVSAVAPGDATLTITASDPGGLQAQQAFQVMVPNRPPSAEGAIPSVTVSVGRTESVYAPSYFTEPDGEELTYTAASSNPAVAVVSVSGSFVRVSAVAEGTTNVTVTATDPGGLSATQSFVARVPSRAFRDDFDSSASLDDWEVANARAVVNNGLLELTATSPGRLAFVGRVLEPPVSSWTMETRMGLAQQSYSHVGLRWFTGHPRFTRVVFFIYNYSNISNYNLQVYDRQNDVWDLLRGGRSTAINDDAGELTTITLSFLNGRVKGLAGDSELFDFETTELGTAVFSQVHGVLLTSRYAGAGNSTVLFDWIDVAGDEVSSGGRRVAKLLGLQLDGPRESARWVPDIIDPRGTIRPKHLVISSQHRR